MRHILWKPSRTLAKHKGKIFFLKECLFPKLERGCSAQIRVWELQRNWEGKGVFSKSWGLWELLCIGFSGNWLMPKAQWCTSNDLPVLGGHLPKAVLCCQLETVKVESLLRYISLFHRTKWLHRDALSSSLP